MNVRLQTSKDSIEQILKSQTFADYMAAKTRITESSEYQQLDVIIHNKDKFSIEEYNDAKLKLINIEMELKPYREELDWAFNQILQNHGKN